MSGMSDVAKWLRAGSEVAKAALPAIPSGPGQTVASILGLALDAGAAIADRGQDPVLELQRILSSVEGVRDVHDRWKRDIDSRFPTDPPDTDPHGSDGGAP